jgi:hypothetical protein
MRDNCHACCTRYLRTRKERANQNQDQCNVVLHTFDPSEVTIRFYAFHENCQEHSVKYNARPLNIICIMVGQERVDGVNKLTKSLNAQAFAPV